jgi:hypothetical protein
LRGAASAASCLLETALTAAAPTHADADFFPHDSDAAFANIVLAVGVASAIGFFFFPQLTRPEAATSALVSSCVAVVAYLLAEMVHRRKAQAAAIGQALT